MKYAKLKDQQQLDMECFSVGCDAHLRPGAVFGPVVRDYYVIECCTEGDGAVIINNRTFPLKGGDLIILRPGDTLVHLCSVNSPRKGYWCNVFGMAMEGFLRQAQIDSQQPYAPREAFPFVLEALKGLYERREEKDSGAPLRASGTVLAIMGEILRYAPRRERSYIREALHLMEARYDQLKDVAEIAAALGLDRSYFSVLFKAETGLPPARYLLELRVRKSLILLKTTDCNMTEVALACGLPPENYCRVFKKVMGSTPSEYRRSLKQS